MYRIFTFNLLLPVYGLLIRSRVKDKAVPLKAWIGPGHNRNLNSDFITTAQVGG